MSTSGDNAQQDPSAAQCVHCSLPVPTSRRRRGGEGASFCCLGCHLVHQMVAAGEGGDEGEGPVTSPFLLRLGLGIFLSMNIMAFSGFFYSQHIYDSSGEISAAGSTLASMFSYLLLMLCTLVIVLLGTPLMREAMENCRRDESKSLRHRLPRVDVNLLILVGVVTAYGMSALSTLRGHGHLYYDTAAMILVLVTLGSYLDARAKRKATASGNALLASLPVHVDVQQRETFVQVEASAVNVGDTIRIRPGETIAIDGIIMQGCSFIDESVLTGESQQRSATIGQQVLAGAMNLDGVLLVCVTMPAGSRVIDHIKRMLDEARLRQPSIQRLADRVASLFIPFVMLLAAATLAWHGANRGIEAGLFAALSVLLISCPCALGLAAPLACYHALSRAAARGMLIDSPATLEKLAAIRTVLLDKTGTLTQGRMTVDDISVTPNISLDDALTIAAAIEAAANHPIARAIISRAAHREADAHSATQVRLIPGRGVEGFIEGRRYLLGNAQLAIDSGCDAHTLLHAGAAGTHVYLIENHQVLARFTLTDECRAEAPQVLATLRDQGMNLMMLTGDHDAPAAKLARELKLDYAAGLLPVDKVDALQKQRTSTTAKIAFVGDGVNDAPVMGVADVGIAVGNATDLARQAGHVHLIGEGIDRLPLLFDLSREAVRRVRLNLLWAFGYNAIGLTLATLGLLTPIFAASSMVISSLLIVVTSSRAFRTDLVHASNNASDHPVNMRSPELAMVSEPTRAAGAGVTT